MSGTWSRFGCVLLTSSKMVAGLCLPFNGNSPKLEKSNPLNLSLIIYLLLTYTICQPLHNKETKREREMYGAHPPKNSDDGQMPDVIRTYQTWKGSNVSIVFFTLFQTLDFANWCHLIATCFVHEINAYVNGLFVGV